MTENEIFNVIEKRDLAVSMCSDDEWRKINNRAISKSIAETLEELKQYRSIGTASECREAMEKQRAKKPIDIKEVKYGPAEYIGKCPNCNRIIPKSGLYKKGCPYCMQCIDWSDTP